MQCPYCKEEIADGAKKCKICGEVFGSQLFFKRINGFIAGILSIVVSIGSLAVALLEYKSKVEALLEKEKAVMDKEAAVEILREVPPEVVLNVARRELKPREEVEFNVSPAEVKYGEEMERYNRLISDANRALELGNKDEAERLYMEAGRLERSFPELREISEAYASKGMGYLNIERNEPKEAVREYEKAVRRAPKDMEARKGLIAAKILSEKER